MECQHLQNRCRIQGLLSLCALMAAGGPLRPAPHPTAPESLRGPRRCTFGSHLPRVSSPASLLPAVLEKPTKPLLAPTPPSPPCQPFLPECVHPTRDRPARSEVSKAAACQGPAPQRGSVPLLLAVLSPVSHPVSVLRPPPGGAVTDGAPGLTRWEVRVRGPRRR